MENLTLEQKAKAKLLNGCQSVKLGKIALALDSHSATCDELHTFNIEPDHGLFGYHPERVMLSQELLSATLNFNTEEYDLYFFEKSNLVSLVSVIRFQDQDGKEDTMIDPEPSYIMTIENFFRFLNTLPNLKAFVETDNQFSLYKVDTDGLELLTKFANYN